MASICETSGYAVVRYSLNGGGCSGLIGKWEPETHYEPSEGDMTWSLGEDKVFVIDEFTLQHMEDATIDYEGDLCQPLKWEFLINKRAGVAKVSKYNIRV